MNTQVNPGRDSRQIKARPRSPATRLRCGLWLALLPLSAFAQALAPPVVETMSGLAGHVGGTVDATRPGVGPRIPDEPACTLIRSLAMSGDATPHYRWALRYVDRQDDPVSGRCIGPTGLQIALQRLQNVIVARGYVTTRVVVASHSSEGTLTFAVVPGRVGRVQFLPDIGRATALRNTVPLRHGALLNLRAIKQVLGELRPLPATDADIRILPASDSGSADSESDLLIVWQPSPRRQVGFAALRKAPSKAP